MTSLRIMRQSDTPLLTINNLCIESQGDISKQIIEDVSLSLKRGEVLGIIGESGAGKSTLGLAAMGYVRSGCRITGGSVLFNGTDLVKIGDREKRDIWGRRVAYIAQSAAASFNPAHKLIAQCVEAPVWHKFSSYKEAKCSMVELFRRLQLPDPEKFGFRYPHQVSGGQLQRAMTAMAFSCQPELLVFDEPTTALDVTTQIEVLASIRDVVRQFHTAAIYISHDLALVAQIADRIMVVRHGRLVEEAPTRQMLSNPQKPYTKSLWAVRSLHKREEPADVAQLALKGIHASYGQAKILHDITFNVPRGQTVAVVGESGSGKSTIARVIMGLLPPTAGSVSFNDTSLPPALKDRPKDLLRQLQMIYQSSDTALNPCRSVKDILGRPLTQMGLRGAARVRRIIELLDMIELNQQYMHRLPNELSGGEKQRICIARALAVQPSLIICDEVTSALDQLVAEEILKLLMRLQKELKISYLYITHDLATVKAIADQVVVMHHGRIVESGARSQIMNPPHHPYTEKLLSSVPEMNPDWLTTVLDKRRQAGATDN